MSIKTAVGHGVATIEIARPEKKNAITVAMYAAMAEALAAAQADAAVRETKRLLRRASADEVLAAIAVEGRLFAERLRSPEAMEAFQAFFQKRKPDFTSFS